MVNILLNFSDFFHSKPPFHIIIGKCQLSCGDMRQDKMSYKLRKKRCWAWQCIFPSTTTQKWKKTLRLTSKKKKIKKSYEAKNKFIKSFDSINPVIAFHNQINSLTGTDYYAYLHYRKHIQSIIDKKVGLILEETWNKVTVNKKKYVEYVEKFKW